MAESRYEAPTIIEIGSVHELTQVKVDGGCDLVCQIANTVPGVDINISGSFPPLPL